MLADASFAEALCSTPPVFDHSTITVWPTGRTSSDTVYQYDNRVTYTCNAGYYVEPGSWAFASSCTRYGTWSDLVDRCTRTFIPLYSCLCIAVHIRLDRCTYTCTRVFAPLYTCVWTAVYVRLYCSSTRAHVPCTFRPHLYTYV